jgi:hypothetical protein
VENGKCGANIVIVGEEAMRRRKKLLTRHTQNFYLGPSSQKAQNISSSVLKSAWRRRRFFLSFFLFALDMLSGLAVFSLN